MSAKIENSTVGLLNAMLDHVNALADENIIDPVRIRYAIGDRKILAAQFHAQGLSNVAIAEVLGIGEATVRRDLASPNDEADTNDQRESEESFSPNGERDEEASETFSEGEYDADESDERDEKASKANQRETPPASHWSTILSAANAAGREVPWDVEAVAKMLDSTDRFIKRNELRDRPMTREEAEEFTSRLGMLEWLEQQFDLLCGELTPGQAP